MRLDNWWLAMNNLEKWQQFNITCYLKQVMFYDKDNKGQQVSKMSTRPVQGQFRISLFSLMFVSLIQGQYWANKD